MSWIILFVAGLFEIAWTVFLKYTHGFTRWVPTVFMVLCMCASTGLVGIAVKKLPLGTAYAVWTGMGTVGTAVMGIYLFKESANPLRIASMALIIAGIIGLKLTAQEG